MVSRLPKSKMAEPSEQVAGRARMSVWNMLREVRSDHEVGIKEGVGVGE